MAESLVKQFQQLQEERVRTFRQLDDDHKVFLGHAPNYEQGFDDYKKAVNNCTERFKEISKEIIQIKETLLKDPNTNKVASLIGQVQELEETKIHTVVDLQLARYNKYPFSFSISKLNIAGNKLLTILEMICARRMLT